MNYKRIIFVRHDPRGLLKTQFTGSIEDLLYTDSGLRHGVYTFKGFVLFRDSFITLYTTNGSDSPTSLFWNQNDAVWKKGDTVTLKQGAKVMATYTVK